MKSFTLDIITQERPLLSESVSSLTATTQAGEVTILADHAPLFSPLTSGELSYIQNSKQVHFALTGGFIDVSPTGHVTILADSAIRSDEINLQKVTEAINSAKQALKQSTDKQTTLKIEIELRHAILQEKVAKRRHQTTS